MSFSVILVLILPTFFFFLLVKYRKSELVMDRKYLLPYLDQWFSYYPLATVANLFYIFVLYKWIEWYNFERFWHESQSTICYLLGM